MMPTGWVQFPSVPLVLQSDLFSECFEIKALTGSSRVSKPRWNEQRDCSVRLVLRRFLSAPSHGLRTDAIMIG